MNRSQRDKFTNTGVRFALQIIVTLTLSPILRSETHTIDMIRSGGYLYEILESIIKSKVKKSI